MLSHDNAHKQAWIAAQNRPEQAKETKARQGARTNVCKYTSRSQHCQGANADPAKLTRFSYNWLRARGQEHR